MRAMNALVRVLFRETLEMMVEYAVVAAACEAGKHIARHVLDRVGVYHPVDGDDYETEEVD